MKGSTLGHLGQKSNLREQLKGNQQGDYEEPCIVSM